MPHLLKNKDLTIHIDLPDEGYAFSRFDWTGKITEVIFRGIPITGQERPDTLDENLFGKGFYNEFGIDAALDFEEAEIGGWFHKIGIGLLQKEGTKYLFHKKHQIRPAEFKWSGDVEKIVLTCTSEPMHGYAYVLEKQILLNDKGFEILYQLKNTGTKRIHTQEYVHNFMALDEELIGPDYTLRLPFRIKTEGFGEAVDPEDLVKIGPESVTFKSTPSEQFFFSHLSGTESVKAQWELVHRKSQLRVRESGNFKTDKVNLWGWRHVVSPELFFDLEIDPGEMTNWSRSYKIYSVNE